MRNRQNKFLDKKIPTIVAVLFLIISVISLTWIDKNTLLFGTKAAVGNTPKQVQISNISDSSFTVSFFTDERNLGTITYGKDQKMGKIALDDRDQQSATPSAYRAHHITVNSLDPSTKYYFSIFSGDALFTNNNQLYEVVTAPRVAANPVIQVPIVGKVTLDDATLPTEAIAYISSENLQLLSVLLKPDGSYLIPLNTIRKSDLSSFASLLPTNVLHLVITSPTMQSNISLLASQINPVPLVILSKDYDFATSNLPLAPAMPASSSASQASGAAQKADFPNLADSTPASGPAILSPNADEKLKDAKPMFTGKALPDTNVEVIIQSQTPIDTSVTSDSIGNWSYQPETPLDPGLHTISIKSPDSSGIMKTLSRSFTVYAAGSMFADPTTTPPPFNLPSLAPKVTPTIAPTIAPPSQAPSPTIKPTIAPTVSVPTLLPTAVSSSSSSSLNNNPTITAKPPLPKSGSSSFITGIIATVSITITGAILFFLTRGGSVL